MLFRSFSDSGSQAGPGLQNSRKDAEQERRVKMVVGTSGAGEDSGDGDGYIGRRKCGEKFQYSESNLCCDPPQHLTIYKMSNQNNEI